MYRTAPVVPTRPDVPAIAISDDLLRGVFAHARDSFPHECCGYLVGPRGGQSVTAAVRCTNVDPHPATGYGIDGRELLDFARTFEAHMPARVLYHSHPNGRAYFSPRDRELAGGYPVQHLVVGLDEHEVVEVALFAAVDGDFVEVWRLA
jgi:proteasome lid subunit RPN8/RPN11